MSTEPEPQDDLAAGVARLESTLAGTRVNAERALRDLHAHMNRDLELAERRARRAERQVANLRRKLKVARRRKARAEARAGAAGPTSPPTPVQAARSLAGSLVRAARQAVDR